MKKKRKTRNQSFLGWEVGKETPQCKRHLSLENQNNGETEGNI